MFSLDKTQKSILWSYIWLSSSSKGFGPNVHSVIMCHWASLVFIFIVSWSLLSFSNNNRVNPLKHIEGLHKTKSLYVLCREKKSLTLKMDVTTSTIIQTLYTFKGQYPYLLTKYFLLSSKQTYKSIYIKINPKWAFGFTVMIVKHVRIFPKTIRLTNCYLFF